MVSASQLRVVLGEAKSMVIPGRPVPWAFLFPAEGFGVLGCGVRGGPKVRFSPRVPARVPGFQGSTRFCEGYGVRALRTPHAVGYHLSLLFVPNSWSLWGFCPDRLGQLSGEFGWFGLVLEFPIDPKRGSETAAGPVPAGSFSNRRFGLEES